MTDPSHPCRALEGTRAWRALDEALRDLERNRDVELTTGRPHVVGYLCQALASGGGPREAGADLVRESEGWAALQAIEDPVVRNLVQVVFGEARLQSLQRPAETEAEWRARLPAADFDVAFLVRVVTTALQDRALVRSLLDGQSIERAAGWDV